MLTLLSAHGLARQAAVPAGARFEAASVKPTPKDNPRNYAAWEFFPNGNVTFRNAPLRLIIMIAHDRDIRFDSVLIAGSQPVLQQPFDIDAKAPEGTNSRKGATAMLRALLAERFGLRTHSETRDVPVFALTVARSGKLGANLKEATVDCSGYSYAAEPKGSARYGPCFAYGRRDAVKMRLHESGPMALFAQRLEQYTDRPLDEQTGLTGLFEWDVTFSVNRDPAADPDVAPLESAITNQLGLKLVPRMSPRQVLVIDSVEAPTEN